MIILRRHSLSLLVFCSICVSFLLGLLAPAPVRAGGAQPVLPGGSSIQPGGETPIQMAAELVTMNIRAAGEADDALVKMSHLPYTIQGNPTWFTAVAEVEADFKMKNPTGEAVHTTVWFPLASALESVEWNFMPDEIAPRLESLQVSVDGNPVEYAVTELPNPKGADKPSLPWASFQATFPVGAETVIHVRYKLPLQPFSVGSVILYYLFHGGAGWAGPVGQTELTLNLPYPASPETIAGMPSGSLRLPPYNMPGVRVDLPAGAVVDGKRVRWTWKGLEPGPADDFALWLLPPGKWQELEIARAAVQAKPQDGQAWLDLAFAYYSVWGANLDFPQFSPTIFGPNYIAPGIEANLRAAELLPEHPAPHAGLGLLLLAPYIKENDAPPIVVQYAQDEFQIATEMAASNPSLAKAKSISWWLLVRLERALRAYPPNEAVATAEQPMSSTEWAKVSAYEASLAAQLAVQLATPSAAPTFEPTATSTTTPKPSMIAAIAPSRTPQPPLATPPKRAETTGSGKFTAIVVAVGVIVLVVVGYLVMKRWQRTIATKDTK